MAATLFLWLALEAFSVTGYAGWSTTAPDLCTGCPGNITASSIVANYCSNYSGVVERRCCFEMRDDCNVHGNCSVIG